ncbi:MAG: FKBP-type peptidyl-prolyl cis-trans isomerase [Rhizomicrobium sp.]|jgi:FKBP-type peptidyl-prolyl cis-trans isomerase FklB
MRVIASVVLSAALMTGYAFAGDLSPKANADFLAANAKKSDTVSVPGIQYQVLKKGTGAQPTRSDCVTVYYSGSLIDGKVFDATKPGKPATFSAGGVISGWVEALQMMHAGDKWRLVIPAGLAYGKAGTGDSNNTIPGGQTLIFELELLRVTPATEAGCG